MHHWTILCVTQQFLSFQQMDLMNTSLDAEVTNSTVPSMSSFCNLKAFGVSFGADLNAEKFNLFRSCMSRRMAFTFTFTLSLSRSHFHIGVRLSRFERRKNSICAGAVWDGAWISLSHVHFHTSLLHFRFHTFRFTLSHFLSRFEQQKVQSV